MSERRTLLLAPTLVAAQLVVMLDSSVLNVALPSVTAEFGLTATATAWVLNAYFLSFGGLLLVSGRAADVFGRRRMFLLGAATLAAGSMVGAAAPSELALVAARVMQGVGAAMLSPAAMSVLLTRFSGPERARTMSWWGAASTAGGALGVSIGGLLAGALGWRSAMAMTLVVALGVLFVGRLVLPADERGARRPFDGRGAGLLTVAVVATVGAVLNAPQHGLGSAEVLVAAGAAVLAAFGFVVVERRATDPVLSIGALREGRVAGGIIVNMLGGAARIACFTLAAILLQQVLEYAPSVAGLAMLPTSLAGFVVSTLVLPHVLNRFGPERTAAIGLIVLVVAHVLLAGVDVGAPYAWRVLPALLLAAVGVAFSFTPTTLVIADGMAARNAGVSSGLASATAQLGGAVGIAVFGAVDAMARSSVSGAGGTALAAADAGLTAAHIAAATAALIAAAVAVVAFPSLRPLRRERVVAASPRTEASAEDVADLLSSGKRTA